MLTMHEVPSGHHHDLVASMQKMSLVYSATHLFAALRIALPAGNGNTGPPDPWLIAGIIGSAVGLSSITPIVLLVLYRRYKVRLALNEREGVPAMGKVLLIETISPYGGVKTRYQLTVEVAPVPSKGVQIPFTTVVTTSMPAANLATVQVGATIALRVAAKDNIEVVLPGAEP